MRDSPTDRMLKAAMAAHVAIPRVKANAVKAAGKEKSRMLYVRGQRGVE